MSAARGALFRKPEFVDALGSMLSKLLPELAIVATVAMFLFAPDYAHWLDPQALGFAAIAEGATLMLSATLIDVASRLRHAPPWWLGILIGGGVLVMYPDAIAMIQMAWAMGMWVFLPFVWSLFERLRELWTLPSASALEKIRRRTLTFDRMYTALMLAGIAIAMIVINAIFNDSNAAMDLIPRGVPWVMLAFYAIAAGNIWRVHQQRFAKRPRSLWPKIDQGQATYLDPL